MSDEARPAPPGGIDAPPLNCEPVRYIAGYVTISTQMLEGYPLGVHPPAPWHRRVRLRIKSGVYTVRSTLALWIAPWLESYDD